MKTICDKRNEGWCFLHGKPIIKKKFRKTKLVKHCYVFFT